MRSLAEQYDKTRQTWIRNFLKKNYKVFKYGQVIYALREKAKKNRISRLNLVKVAREQYFKRIKGRKYSSFVNVSKALMASVYLKNKTDFNYSELAFLLWAACYERFTKREYLNDFGEHGVNFYSTVYRLMDRGYIEKAPIKEGHHGIYYLTGEGRKNVDRIEKFVKRNLHERKDRDIRDKVSAS